MSLRGLHVWPLSSGLASAQVTGRLTGSVIDPSGAAEPKPSVSLALHGGKRALLSTLTSHEGTFAIERVRPELYDVPAEAGGFQNYKLENVQIDPARSTDLAAFKLALESVEVKSAAESVQPSRTDMSTRVTAEQIRRLPIGDRILWPRSVQRRAPHPAIPTSYRPAASLCPA